MYSVTVQELLNFPLIKGLKILAGWESRNKPVQRVFLLHSNAESHLIKPGDLVLLEKSSSLDFDSGYIFKAAAIAIVGETDQLTSRLLSEDDFDIPVVGLEEADIQALQASLPFLQQLKSSGLIEMYLENCYLTGLEKSGGVPAWLSAAKEYISNPIWLVDIAFHPIIHTDSVEVLQYIFRHYRVARRGGPSGWKVFSGSFIAMEQQTVTYHILPLDTVDCCYGYLVSWQCSGEFTCADKSFLYAAGKLIRQDLVQRQKADDIERRYQDSYIYDLLYNNIDSRESLIERGKLWGWDFARPQHLFLISVATGDNGDYFEAEGFLKLVLRTAKAYSVQAIVSEQQSQIVVIVPNENVGHLQISKQNSINLAKALRTELLHKFPEKQVMIGIGKSYPSITDLHRSYQEAKTAIELGSFLQHHNHVVHFEDLGIIRLLATISYEQLYDYYREYLGPLEEYDAANTASLLETLQAWFEQNGDLNATAEKLFLHPNSLRYRMKKIEEILNGDLQSQEYKLNLFAAYQIKKIRKSSLWR